MAYGIARPGGGPNDGTPQTYIQAPTAPTPQPEQPGALEKAGTEYVSKKAGGFLDDTVTPWMKDTATPWVKDAVGMAVPGAEAGAITSGVATGTEAAMAAELGTGIATAGTGAAAAGGAAAGGGAAMAGLMAAAPYAAAAYGLYRLLK